MQVHDCARVAPPIDPAMHRRIRLRRFGLQGATARLVADLAFGSERQDHDTVLSNETAIRPTAAEVVRALRSTAAASGVPS